VDPEPRFRHHPEVKASFRVRLTGQGESMRLATAVLTLGTGLLLAAGAPAQTQQSDDAAKISEMEINMMRKDLRDQKKQIIAANMPLTGDEAAKFWPLYDAYTQETIKLNDDRLRLVKDYAANYKTMTDDGAASYIRNWIKADQAASKLRLDWISKFEHEVGEKKAAIFFQLDRRISLMLELQLAAQVPLVQP
jgi:hypothetical protein